MSDEDQNPDEEAQDGALSDEQETGDQEDHSDDESGSESDEEDQDDENRDTFPRAYVEKLRKQSAGYRERAKHGETALSRLADAVLREATRGILVDPTDLTYDDKTMTDDEGFPDLEKIKGAATELVEKKPHLAPRRPRGDIGQGTKSKEDDFSLAGILRSNAG